MWRLLTDGLFHACTAAITCYFIGLAVKNPRWQVQLIAFGLGMTSLLHGVSDRYSDGWGQVAVAAILLFIFIGYVLSGDRIETQVCRGSSSGEHGRRFPGRLSRAHARLRRPGTRRLRRYCVAMPGARRWLRPGRYEAV